MELQVHACLQASERQNSPLPRSVTCCRGMFAAVLESCPLPALVQYRMLTVAKDLECAVNKQKMQDSDFHKASTKMNAEAIFTATKETNKHCNNKKQKQKRNQHKMGRKEEVEDLATDNFPALYRKPVPEQRKARETCFKLNNYWITCCSRVLRVYFRTLRTL